MKIEKLSFRNSVKKMTLLTQLKSLKETSETYKFDDKKTILNIVKEYQEVSNSNDKQAI